ncbi:MAG TPA: hypothetical protein VIM61_04745 [Chthoniobacterales bacterium]
MIIESIFASAVTSGALIWLTKSWISERLKRSIQHEYDQKLESYKVTLKAESDVTLEKLRADLQIAAAKRNIEYSRIHEKRLDIISELAGKIDALHQAAAAYVSMFEWKDGDSKEDRRKFFADRLGEFNRFYRPRRLFIPPDLASKIESFSSGLYNISIEFMIHVEQAREHGGHEDIDRWTKASEYTSQEAPKLITELECEFRTLLGIAE